MSRPVEHCAPPELCAFVGFGVYKHHVPPGLSRSLSLLPFSPAPCRLPPAVCRLPPARLPPAVCLLPSAP